MKRGLPICLFFLLCAAPAPAQDKPDKPKPEIKGRSLLAVRSGQTATLILYGENLAPKAVTVNKPPLTAKLLDVKPTEGDDKKRGSQQVSVELAVPAGTAPDIFDIILVHEGDVKVIAPVAVAEEAGIEAEVKRPNATFTQAMPLPGPSAAITGALMNNTPDIFRFDAKVGETWVIALLAGRAGSALDALVRVRDRRHFSLALSAGDEKQDRLIAFRAPKDGTYYIEVWDAEARGGPEYLYRLTVRHDSASPAPANGGTREAETSKKDFTPR